MGILDEAIREHLELKRQHGAARLRAAADRGRGIRPAGAPGEPKLVPPSRLPEAEAEAPTEFMPQPISSTPAPEEPRRPPSAESPAAARGGASGAGARAVPEQPTRPQTRAASIVDQPTELYDVEAEIASSAEQPQPPSDARRGAEVAEPTAAAAGAAGRRVPRPRQSRPRSRDGERVLRRAVALRRARPGARREVEPAGPPEEAGRSRRSKSPVQREAEEPARRGARA